MLPRQTVEIGGRMLEMEDQVEALQQEYVIRVTPGQPSGADWSVHAIVLRDHRQQVLRHVGRSRTCGVRRHQISLGGEFEPPACRWSSVRQPGPVHAQERVDNTRTLVTIWRN